MLVYDNRDGSADSSRIVALAQRGLHAGSENLLFNLLHAFDEASSIAIAAITKQNFGAEK